MLVIKENYHFILV